MHDRPAGGRALRHPHARPRRPLARASRSASEFPETAVIMATGVQRRRPRRHEPAAGRHRLPDQAVRARSAARSRDPRARVAPAPRGTRAAGASRSSRRWRSAAPRLSDALAVAAHRQRRGARRDAVDADAHRPRMPTRTPTASPRSRSASARTLRLRDEELAAIEHGGAAARRRQARRCPEAILRKPAPLTERGAGAGPPAPDDRQRSDRARAVSRRRRRAGPRRARADGRARLSATAVTPRRSSLGARIVCRRRRLRHDDAPARLPRCDQSGARRCSKSSAAAGIAVRSRRGRRLQAVLGRRSVGSPGLGAGLHGWTPIRRVLRLAVQSNIDSQSAAAARA